MRLLSPPQFERRAPPTPFDAGLYHFFMDLWGHSSDPRLSSGVGLTHGVNFLFNGRRLSAITEEPWFRSPSTEHFPSSDGKVHPFRLRPGRICKFTLSGKSSGGWR